MQAAMWPHGTKTVNSFSSMPGIVKHSASCLTPCLTSMHSISTYCNLCRLWFFVAGWIPITCRHSDSDVERAKKHQWHEVVSRTTQALFSLQNAGGLGNTQLAIRDSAALTDAADSLDPLRRPGKKNFNIRHALLSKENKREKTSRNRLSHLTHRC